MIRNITIQGSKSTNPSGIDMEEFLRSRILRLKKASFGDMAPRKSEKLSTAGNRFENGKLDTSPIEV